MLISSTVHEIVKVIAACRSVIDAGSRGVLVTVIRTEGSTYRRAGARAVIGQDGTLAGAISGGGLGRAVSEPPSPWAAHQPAPPHTEDATPAGRLSLRLRVRDRLRLDLLNEPGA